LAANALAQPGEQPSIIVAGRIESRRLTVTAADLGGLPKKTVKVKTDHESRRLRASQSKTCWSSPLRKTESLLVQRTALTGIVAPQDAN